MKTQACRHSRAVPAVGAVGSLNDDVFCCTAYPTPAIEVGKYFITFRLQAVLDFRNHPLIIDRAVLLHERVFNILHQG